MTSVALSSDGISICFEVHGTEGSPLVLVHGWSCDRGVLARAGGALLAAAHRVVTRSTWRDTASRGSAASAGRCRRSATTSRRWSRSSDLDNVVLVGHSMGGDVIVETALRLRGRVAGLVWVDVYSKLGDSGHRDADAFMEPFRQDFVAATRDFVRMRLCEGASDAGLVEWIAADMSSAPREIALDAMRHAIMNDDAILSALREFEVPFFAINPDHRPTDVDSLRRHGVEPVVMSGVAHFLMLEDPIGFNRILGEVLEQISSPRSRRKSSNRGDN